MDSTEENAILLPAMEWGSRTRISAMLKASLR
jgi:hypothetical protein